MPIDINKHEVDIDTLFKQNENDLSSIKEHYKKLKDLEKKITQIKYIDTTLADKLKKDYENLKRIILDENIQIQLNNKINEINSQLDNLTNHCTGGNGMQEHSHVNKTTLDKLGESSKGKLTYNGSEKCVSGLLFDKESDSYYFLFGNGKWSITCNDEYHQYLYSNIISKKNRSLTFDFIEKNNKLLQMIKLNNKDSYSDMRRLWEIVSEDT